MAAFTLTPQNLLLVLAVILLFGFFGQWMFKKTRVPDTLLLMLVGFAIGQLFDIDTAPFLAVMPFIGVLALITILFDGGLDLKVKDLVSGLPRASALSFAGFGLSVLLVMIYSHFVFEISFLKGILLGAIIGGTSAVIIMPMLPGLQLGKKSETMLGLESALTDVLCVVVALPVALAISQGKGGAGDIISALAASFAIGLVIGVVAGLGWLLVVDKVRTTGSEYVWTATALFLLFGVVELLRGSGPIAVLTFGIILGNATRITKMFNLPTRRLSYTVDRMQDELVFFVRAFFFVFLGVVFDPSFIQFTPILTSPIMKSLGLLLVLVIARAGAVALATLGDRKLIEHRVRFLLLMPRGLAAAVLAAIPAAAPYFIEGVDFFVSYAFAILLYTNVLATIAGLLGSDKSKFKISRIGKRGTKAVDDVGEKVDKMGRATGPKDAVP